MNYTVARLLDEIGFAPTFMCLYNLLDEISLGGKKMANYVLMLYWAKKPKCQLSGPQGSQLISFYADLPEKI